MSDTINIIKDKIDNEVGVLYYASSLLKEYNIENTGRNQYQLLVWLEKENKGKIINHLIKNNNIIRPKDKTDILKICSFKITMNQERKEIIENDYCITYPDLFLFKSKKQPGYDAEGNAMPDMQCNDKTDSEMLKLGKVFKYTIDEYNKILTRELYLANPSGFMNCKIGELLHVCEMRDLLQSCSIFDLEMRMANDELLNHFITGNGSDFISPILTNEVRENKSTKNYVNYAVTTIKKYLKQYNGDIYELIDDNSINNEFQMNATFPKFENPFTGLMIAIHVTHGNNIKITNTKIENNILKCKLQFDIFDHYGLNSDDLNCSKLKIKFKDLAGFRAWYYLQHSVNYKGNFKPFITHAIFYEDLEIQL